KTSKSFSSRSVSTLRTCGSSSTIRREHFRGVTSGSRGGGRQWTSEAASGSGGGAKRLPRLIAHPDTVFQTRQDSGSVSVPGCERYPIKRLGSGHQTSFASVKRQLKTL